ncbi:mCG145984, partial [Mus musculus]
LSDHDSCIGTSGADVYVGYGCFGWGSWEKMHPRLPFLSSRPWMDRVPAFTPPVKLSHPHCLFSPNTVAWDWMFITQDRVSLYSSGHLLCRPDWLRTHRAPSACQAAGMKEAHRGQKRHWNPWN